MYLQNDRVALVFLTLCPNLCDYITHQLFEDIVMHTDYTAIDPIIKKFLITNMSADNECRTRRQAISTVSTDAFISRLCQHDRFCIILILCHYPEWIQVGIRFTQPRSKFDSFTRIMSWSRLMVLQTKTAGCNTVEAVIQRRQYYSHTEAGLLGNPSSRKRIEVRLIFCCLVSHSAPDLIAATQHVSAS